MGKLNKNQLEAQDRYRNKNRERLNKEALEKYYKNRESINARRRERYKNQTNE